MLVRIALYDPSQPSSDGSFWSWRSPGIDRKLLERLYYEVAAASRPKDPSLVSPATVIGGLAQLTAEWTCVYRFGNGGRDARGRPGRFVIFAALIPRGQAAGVDITPLLTCKVVADVLGQAPTKCPVPVPDALEMEFVGEPIRVDPVILAKAMREQRLEFTGPKALAEAGAICAGLPADIRWVCRVCSDSEGIVATLECPKPPAKPEPGPLPTTMADHQPNRPAPAATGNAQPAAARRYRRLAKRALPIIVAFALIGILYLVWPARKTWPAVVQTRPAVVQTKPATPPATQPTQSGAVRSREAGQSATKPGDHVKVRSELDTGP